MRIVVLPAAREDLRDIWRFGAQTWGEGQADRYADLLDAAIRGLALQPFTGPSAEDVSPGLRRLVARSHVVFYRVDKQVVRIIRVLHQSRDAARWLA
ncbi:MAG: type II toxin-antitoxin system RelE/ParE family toxin [Gemmobacter sp.]